MCSFGQILNAAQIASLTVIAGGTVTLGALVAPQLFGNASKQEAGKLMTSIFNGFDQWLRGAAFLLIAVKLLHLIVVDRFIFFTPTGFQWGLVLSSVLVLAVTAISLHLVYRTSPELVAAMRANKKEDFERLHRESELLHRINFGLALGLLWTFA